MSDYYYKDWKYPARPTSYQVRRDSSGHSSLQKTPRQSIDGASTLVDYPRCESPEREDKHYEEDEPVLQFREAPVETQEYPSVWKLTLITTGICLSVFCMALVWLTYNALNMFCWNPILTKCPLIG